MLTPGQEQSAMPGLKGLLQLTARASTLQKLCHASDIARSHVPGACQATKELQCALPCWLNSPASSAPVVAHIALHEDECHQAVAAAGHISLQ